MSPVSGAGADDLAAVIADAKLDHVTLVGVSSGGGIALDYALDHPQTVDRLVLVGAQIDGFELSDHFNTRNRRASIRRGRGQLAERSLSVRARRPGRPRPGEGALEGQSQDISHLRSDPARPGPSALPRMPGLKAPTLIVAGDHDIPDVQAMAGAAQVLIPGAKRVVIENSGRLVQLEQPDRLASLIRDFVRKPG